MPDPRFYEDLGPVSLQDLAQLCGASLADAQAGSVLISNVAPLERAGEGGVSFFAARRYAEALSATKASACFVRPDQADRLPLGCAALVTREPQMGYVRAAERLHRARIIPNGDVRVDPTSHCEDGVVLAPGVVLGPGVRVGRGTTIGANAVIGAGVSIGRGCAIGANVSISFTLIGDRVRILAGAMIGEAGFGMAGGQAGVVDVPQLGRVVLQDGVTVGAGTCVDRGAWDDTVIGENSKLDNLVQVGHNVRMGRNCVAAAHTGISGSVTIGDGVRFGGRAGIADHLTIGDGATIMAAAGLMNNIPAGETWGGYPATPARQWMRQVVWLARKVQGRGESRLNEKDRNDRDQ